MVLDVGRVKHRADLMHRSTGSNGLAVPSNWRLAADGLTNVVWSPEGGGTLSYGSNATNVSSVSAGGVMTEVIRADHVHRGIRTITSNSSNGLFGDVNLQAGSGIALGVAGQTVTVVNTGQGGGSGGGGSGITHAYLGYNTAGGSTETMTNSKVYAKKVTVAAAGLLSSISCYVDNGATDNGVAAIGWALFTDNAGTPEYIIGSNGPRIDSLFMDTIVGGGGNTNPRWYHMGCGPIYLAAGDYWIAVSCMDNDSPFRIYYDGSGSDRTYASGGAWFADWGAYTPTTTSNRYSIRASIIT